jgi:hypothetical protein
LNILEVLATEVYTDKNHYYRDVADPRYKGDPEFRNAINKKLERSMPTLRASLPPSGDAKVHRSVSVHRDKDGKIVVTPMATDPGYTQVPSSDAQAVALENGRWETLPGGTMRFTRKG